MPVLWLLLTACSAPPAAAQAQTVRGVLVDVVSPGLQQLERFTLRTDAGQEITFVPAPTFNQGATEAMTPGHLRQHMALAEPLVVTYRSENGTFLALSATDATPP